MWNIWRRAYSLFFLFHGSLIFDHLHTNSNYLPSLCYCFPLLSECFCFSIKEATILFPRIELWRELPDTGPLKHWALGLSDPWTFWPSEYRILRIIGASGGSRGGWGVCSNPPLHPSYFIFMGKFKKSWTNWSNRTPFPHPSTPHLANLSPLSKNPGSVSGCIP